MPVTALRVVKPGTITIEGWETPSSRARAFRLCAGIGGGSTVMLVESDRRVLVDTGFDGEEDQSPANRERNRRLLLAALEAADLAPDDVDLVFLTHLHADHKLNVGVFPDAEVAAPAIELAGRRLPFRGVRDGDVLADGVRVMATPGHTRGHCSLLCETDRLRHATGSGAGGCLLGVGAATVAIAGDAVLTAAYFCRDRPWSYNADFFSAEAARESRRRLAAAAAFIVPGHGLPFAVARGETAAP